MTLKTHTLMSVKLIMFLLVKTNADCIKCDQNSQ